MIPVGKLAANGLRLSVGTAGIAVLGFAQGVLLTRSLGPDVFGAWGILTACVGLTVSVFGFRTHEPLTRYMAEFREKGDREALANLLALAIGIDTLTRIAAMIISFVVVSPVWRGVAGQIGPLWAYQLFVITALFPSISTAWFCLEREYRQFGRISVVEFLMVLVRFSLLFGIAAISRVTIETVIVVSIAAGLFDMIVKLSLTDVLVLKSCGYGLRELPYLACWKRREYLAGFWRFMRLGFVSNIFSALPKQADILVVATWVRPDVVGFYKLGKSLCFAINMVVQPLSKVIYKEFCDLAGRQATVELRNEIKRLMCWWTPLACLGGAAVAVAAPYLIKGLYGADYAGAIPIFRVQWIGSVFMLAFFWAHPLVLAQGRIKEYAKVVSLLSLICFLGGMVGQMAFPIWGMAVAMTVFWILQYVSCLVMGLRSLTPSKNGIEGMS